MSDWRLVGFVRVLRPAERACGHPRRSIRHGAILALAGPDIGIYNLSSRSRAARNAGNGSPKSRGTRLEPQRHAACGQITAAAQRQASGCQSLSGT
jgi:hypothetical protein